MPTTHDRVLTLCQEVAAWLRAVAMDEGETLTPEERRAMAITAIAGAKTKSTSSSDF